MAAPGPTFVTVLDNKGGSSDPHWEIMHGSEMFAHIIGYKKPCLPLHGSFSILILIASHLSLSHSLLGTHHVLGQFIHQIFYQGILFTDKVNNSSGSPTYYYKSSTG